MYLSDLCRPVSDLAARPSDIHLANDPRSPALRITGRALKPIS